MGSSRGYVFGHRVDGMHLSKLSVIFSLNRLNVAPYFRTKTDSLMSARMAMLETATWTGLMAVVRTIVHFCGARYLEIWGVYLKCGRMAVISDMLQGGGPMRRWLGRTALGW